MAEAMGKVYGIDLGTTYSCIATLGNDMLPVVVRNDIEDGDATLPSVIYFEPQDEGGQTIVGKQAKEYIAEHGDRVIQYVKREIGEDSAKPHVIDGKEYDAVALSAMILKRIKSYAEATEGEIRDVVITVPAYFDLARREATRQAGIAAGFNVLNVINEPTAAAMSYIIQETNQPREANYLVYDLGGGTFDITMVNVVHEEGYQVQIIATDGNSLLGGADWDQRLADVILVKYYEENGIEARNPDGSIVEPSDDLRYAIASVVEKAKRDLSIKATANVKVKCEDAITKVKVTVEEFEAATKDLVDQTMSLVEKVLKASADRVPEDQITYLLLVGGSTRMPMIQNAVKARFGAERVRVADPDQSVAKGAALYASLLPDPNIERLQKAIEEFREKNGRAPLADDMATILEMAGIAAGAPAGNDSENPADPGNPVEPDPTTIVPPVVTVDETTGEISISAPEEKPKITVYDVSPAAFGPCVLDENGKRVVDNIIAMGAQVPTEEERRYVLPVDDMVKLSIQMYESKTHEPHTTPSMEKDSVTPIPVDPSLQIKYRDRLEIPLPAGAKAGTEVFVKFTIDTSGLVSMAVRIPSLLPDEYKIDFKFFKGDAEDTKKQVDEVEIKTDDF